MAENTLGDKVLDPNCTQTACIVLQIAERIGSVAFIEPLIKSLKAVDDKIGEGGRLTGDSAAYVELIRKALRACTGVDQANGAAYESWWKKSKASVLQKARCVMWCKATGNRWDRAGNDSKATCPHHPDKQQAGRETPVVAMRTLK
jgi:hypothetical protein